MRTIKLNTKAIDYIRAANVIAPKSDVRYYLNAVCIDLTDQPTIVATDGNRLTSSKLSWYEEIEADTQEVGIYLIPKEAAIWISKLKNKKNKYTKLEISFSDDVVLLSYLGTTASFPAINGKFPDWRRVIPKGPPEPTEEIGFNASFLSDLFPWTKALDLSGHPAIKCILRGASSSMVCEHKSHIYLIMPVRI